MTQHRWEEHTNCNDSACWVCVGGLFVCGVCGLFEGCLTTDCPAAPSYANHADDVYSGREDFRDGKWVPAVSPHCPTAHRAKQDALTRS